MADTQKLPKKYISQCLILVEFIFMLEDTQTKRFMQRIVCYTKCLGFALFVPDFTGLHDESSSSVN